MHEANIRGTGHTSANQQTLLVSSPAEPESVNLVRCPGIDSGSPAEPESVNLVRCPGIDFQPGGIDSWARFLGLNVYKFGLSSVPPGFELMSTSSRVRRSNQRAI
jgi:hypothetical protein